MTENEALETALEKVKAQKVNFGFMERFNVDENWEVMKALEEIQQYRAIGLTPKMVKEMIESEKLASHAAIIRGAELELYQAIGTIEEFKALKEKEERFDRNIKMFNEIGLEIRNKAISEFAERLLNCGMGDFNNIPIIEIKRIAEEMRGAE